MAQTLHMADKPKNHFSNVISEDVTNLFLMGIIASKLNWFLYRCKIIFWILACKGNAIVEIFRLWSIENLSQFS